MTPNMAAFLTGLLLIGFGLGAIAFVKLSPAIAGVFSVFG